MNIVVGTGITTNRGDMTRMTGTLSATMGDDMEIEETTLEMREMSVMIDTATD